jgi:hypothetical protein
VAIGSTADNNVLAFDSATGNWTNQTAAQANLATAASPTFTGIVTASSDIDATGQIFAAGFHLPSENPYRYVMSDGTESSTYTAYYALDAERTLANSTAAQNVLASTGPTLFLSASTLYMIEYEYILVAAQATTTSHTIDIRWPYTGTFTTANHYAEFGDGSGSAMTMSAPTITVNGSTAPFGKTWAATTYKYQFLRGVIMYKTNTAGDISPQITFGTAPGGTTAVAAGSFMKVTRLGPTGANTNIGSWI